LDIWLGRSLTFWANSSFKRQKAEQFTSISFLREMRGKCIRHLSKDQRRSWMRRAFKQPFRRKYLTYTVEITYTQQNGSKKCLNMLL
jgi:hypothetical protein